MTTPASEDWWTLAEQLADLAAEVAEVELPPQARLRLIEMIVELLVLITCWPTQSKPAAPLVYLRNRRSRMRPYAPWLYVLPRTTRTLLTGTDRRPSLLGFGVGTPTDPSATLRRAWRNGLAALLDQVEMT